MSTFIFSKFDRKIYKFDPVQGTQISKVYEGDVGKIAFAPDGWIYFVGYSQQRDIFKTKVNEAVQLVYTHPTWIRNVEIRKTDNTGKYRIYFSAHVPGEEDTGGINAIYYLNDQNQAVPYYTIQTRDMGLPDIQCPGSRAYYYDGDFVFDDLGNLYLSTGSSIPSGLFKVTGAGPDKVTGNLLNIHVDQIKPIKGLAYEAPNTLYFSSGEKIINLNLLTMAEKVVYDATDEIIDIALMPSFSQSSWYSRPWEKGWYIIKKFWHR